MYKIKAWFRHYFGFNSRETRGFLGLLFFVAMVLIAPLLYVLVAPSPIPIEMEVEELKVDSLLASTKTNNKTRTKGSSEVFDFDPNFASEQDFLRLGLPPFLAKRIINYRDKGGRFKVKSDFAKIYGLKEHQFNRLAPFIQLPDTLAARSKILTNTKPSVDLSPRKHSINMADTNALNDINGIGTVLAKRIIKYRNALGGFAFENQLYEVYGLDSLVVGKIMDRFDVESGDNIRKILINRWPADSLGKHPYIGRKAAKVLVNYRNQHGFFVSKEDLLKTKVLEPAKIERLLPYLQF